MNNNMLENPIIKKNLEILSELNCFIQEPEIGYLACGENAKGRLADIDFIHLNTLRLLFQNKKNNSKKITITLGGTREKIDSVRYITNASSGKMGIALCDWAYKLGYDVCAISTIELKKPYSVVNVNSAQEMLSELQNNDFDYLIMSAAVGDFRAKKISNIKISKEDIEDNFCLTLTKNPDIVAQIAKNKKENQKIIGFCLTDENLIECAKNKLVNKNLDYIIANDVKIALNTDINKVTIIAKNGKITNIDTDSKENIARKISKAC